MMGTQAVGSSCLDRTAQVWRLIKARLHTLEIVMHSSNFRQQSSVTDSVAAWEVSPPGGGCSTAVPRPAAPGASCG